MIYNSHRTVGIGRLQVGEGRMIWMFMILLFSGMISVGVLFRVALGDASKSIKLSGFVGRVLLFLGGSVSLVMGGFIVGSGNPTDESMQASGKDYKVLSQLEHDGKYYLIIKNVEGDYEPRFVLVSKPIPADAKMVRFNETIETLVVEKK